MKNLEQIRATSVLQAAESHERFTGDQGSENVSKKIPVLIINHGLLQTLAFAKEKKGGYKAILDHLAKHLTDVKIVEQCDNTDDLVQILAKGDSLLLRRATSEALAWFNYARRFIK